MVFYDNVGMYTKCMYVLYIFPWSDEIKLWSKVYGYLICPSDDIFAFVYILFKEF